MTISQKISKAILRHPVLYYVRYLMISKNGKLQHTDTIGIFNEVNDVKTVPQLYFEINALIDPDLQADEFERALQIGRYLRKNIKGGTGLGLASAETLRKMLAGEGGVCSDFSQIFSIFCLINNIPVKEWGCIDRFYKTRFGHSFNEIYSSQRKQWIAIDIHKGIVFENDKGGYFSAVELFEDLRKDHPLRYRFIADYVPVKLERIAEVYSKITIPFIVSNYKNNVNDYFLSRFRKLPPFLINLIMIACRKNHQFVFVLDNYRKKLLQS